ncbi:MAG: hypothetical protein QOE83_1968 [Actinomycetota bacterium]|nr:hypothetical protein [Actinomycetota bacterium]
MSGCQHYQPRLEWPETWQSSVVARSSRLEEVPNEYRYTDCECGARWVEHVRAGLAKQERNEGE